MLCLLQTIISETPDKEWDARLLNSKEGTIYQTTYYANYAQKDIGFKPFYLTCSEEGRGLGQLLLFRSSRYYGLRSKIYYPLLRRFSQRLHWIYGPIVFKEEKYSEVIGSLLKKAAELSAKKGRHIEASSPFPLANAPLVFQENGFKPSAQATFLIDLSQPLETLWKNVDHSARKLVNRTKEEGVQIKVVETEEDLHRYFDVVNENRARNKLSLLPYSSSMWRIFRENKVGEILIAEKDGRVLAGLGISFFNGYLNEWGAGTASFALENKIYASDLLKWHVIEWGKKNNCRYYDLTGVVPNSSDPKEQGIFRYKQKWGGKLVEYNAYSIS